MIVPKEEYIKSYPDWHRTRKNSSSAANCGKIHISENDEEASINNKSSSIHSPQRVIIEKAYIRKAKQRFESYNRNQDSSISKDEHQKAKKMRLSLKTKTRDKQNKIFDPLLRRKIDHGKAFSKKSSYAGERRYNDTNTTYSQLGQRKDKSLRNKNDHGHIHSGYGDILKMIKRKARIQSAHPRIKPSITLNKLSANLQETMTYHHNSPASRPSSSVKSNMREYLDKIVSMAKKREYPSSKEDIRKLIKIRDRVIASKTTDQYYIYEVKEIVNRILSRI